MVNNVEGTWFKNIVFGANIFNFFTLFSQHITRTLNGRRKLGTLPDEVNGMVRGDKELLYRFTDSSTAAR